MADRELLELAARAAGYKRMEYRDDTPYVSAGHLPMDDWTAWNPLTDDGDALRLAVTLRLSVSAPHGHYRAFAQSQDLKRGVSANDGQDELNDTDPFSATRRAITRAAAEIGRQMQNV